MNDSLDLRNRILKMRESNNITFTKIDSRNNNLMSEFESSIKDDNQNQSNSDKAKVNNKSVVSESKPVYNHSEKQVYHSDKSKNKNIISTVNDNDAQFLMLANKFNEAVEVILELSHKVEKLERTNIQNSHVEKNNVNSSSFFSFKVFVFLLLIPILVLSFFTLPLDFSLIKSIVVDVLSTI